MVNATFRAAFPEFTSATVYPDAMLTFWAGVAGRSLDADVCGASYDDLLYLATAHYITLAANNSASVSAGASPGSGGGGLVASKSMGSVSVSYDTGSFANKSAADWNRTTYGQQYYRLIRLFGVGAVQSY
jgi:hypothetical protein